MYPKCVLSKQTTLGLGAEAWLALWLSPPACPPGTQTTSLLPLCSYAHPTHPIEPLCCAMSQAFPLPSLSRKQRTVLVVCGPEQNGAVGLACARHLRVFVSNRAVMRRTEIGLGSRWEQEGVSFPPPSPNPGPPPPQEYQPSIFCPARSADALHRDLTTQCEKMDIPFLSFLPAEVRCTHPAPAPAPALARASIAPRPPTPPLSPGAAHRRRVRAGGGRCAWAGGAAGGSRRALRARAGHAKATLHPACEPGRPLRHATQGQPGYPSRFFPSIPNPPLCTSPRPRFSSFNQLFQPQFPRLPSSCFTPALMMGAIQVAAPSDSVSPWSECSAPWAPPTTGPVAGQT